MKISNTKALTLVEVIFAAALIAIIAVALFNTFARAYNYLQYITELRTATLVLQEQVSRTRDLSYSEIQALGPSFFSTEMAALRNAAGTMSRSSYGGSGTIMKITFALDWTGYNGQPKHKTIVTLMTEDGINKK